MAKKSGPLYVKMEKRSSQGIVKTDGTLEDKTFTATAYIESRSDHLCFLPGYLITFS